MEQEKILAGAEPFRPTNLFPRERLPTYFNRVVVLPCFHDDSSSHALTYADELFFQELSQARLFEPVILSPDKSKELFGKERISSTSALPGDFFEVLQQDFAANGALFVELHSYKPYRPLSLGVRAKLVDLKSGEFMWAIDETFDSGDGSVMVALKEYQNRHYVRAVSKKTSGSILMSPRLFCKFTANSVFSTLPKR